MMDLKLNYKYQLLMTEMESDIIEYYPENYTINCINKYYLWECNPNLPFVIMASCIV